MGAAQHAAGQHLFTSYLLINITLTLYVSLPVTYTYKFGGILFLMTTVYPTLRWTEQHGGVGRAHISAFNFTHTTNISTMSVYTYKKIQHYWKHHHKCIYCTWPHVVWCKAYYVCSRRNSSASPLLWLSLDGPHVQIPRWLTSSADAASCCTRGDTAATYWCGVWIVVTGWVYSL